MGIVLIYLVFAPVERVNASTTTFTLQLMIRVVYQAVYLLSWIGRFTFFDSHYILYEEMFG